MGIWDYSITYIRDSDLLKKLAGLFAGLGHLQPLLLATTNSHYLLDRFCMERCCSSEYISRIVTSIIFMEILAIILVRIVLLIVLGNPEIWKNWSTSEAGKLVGHNKDEEKIRDPISIIILWAIFLGYIQIFYAFTTGGKKGHMEWFYSSLLVQHFLNSLIAGSIGFWEVGLALWYLVTLPMAPIIVFFYQLMIHSWIRNNGPRDVEYLVVENQIWLAICLSCIAAICWMAGYGIPHILNLTMTKKGTQLNLTNPKSSQNITVKWISRTLKIYTVTVTSGTETAKSVKISANSAPVTVKVHSITVTLQNAKPNTVIVYPNKEVTVEVQQSVKVIASVTGTKTVTIKIEQSGDPVYPEVTQTVKSTAQVTIEKIHLALEPKGNIIVAYAGARASGTSVNVLGCSCHPNPSYYINEISAPSALWKEDWEGEKCLFTACYYKGTDPQLLILHVIGNTLSTRYYGKSGQWKIIDSSIFHNKLDELQRTGSIERIDGSAEAKDPQHNTDYNKALVYGTCTWRNLLPSNWKNFTTTWAPLVMQGLSVGAVGSIFPNLIPKTLVCARTTRTLSVINMFLVTVPHIFNVILGDMDVNPASNPWTDWDKNTVWPFSLLLYIFYILAFLFAIFNVHYPEWALSTFLRNNTLMVFLMILFTDVLNETFNAISRAGICSQKAAGGKAKNHPCLHNKIACLMNLTYIHTPLAYTSITSILQPLNAAIRSDSDIQRRVYSSRIEFLESDIAGGYSKDLVSEKCKVLTMATLLWNL